MLPSSGSRRRTRSGGLSVAETTSPGSTQKLFNRQRLLGFIGIFHAPFLYEHKRNDLVIPCRGTTEDVLKIKCEEEARERSLSLFIGCWR